MNERPYFITNRFFSKMRYLTDGRHRWRIENPILFEEVMDEVWARICEGATASDFIPADNYVLIRQERDGLPEPPYPLGSENPFFEVRVNVGVRAIFMLKSHCREEHACCKLCKKELTFHDVGIYGD